MNTGVIIKSVGSHYRVLTGDGRIIECTLRGKLRIRDFSNTNPVAVGDNVIFETEGDAGQGAITEILDRRNYIVRKSSNLSKQLQVIAANIDQALLMATVIMPRTPPEFIDRFLITAEAYNIPAIIILNKTDLYGEEEKKRLDYLVSVYSEIGYRCIKLSLNDNSGLSEVRDIMKGRISLISGNSGVGKTTLLNKLDPELNLKTEEISDFHKQGRHITTFPEMYRLPFGGFAIDTPGLRGFGMINMEKNEIYHFFPEIFRQSKNCRFYNCLHLDEPGCAVREAVENGKIDMLRYKSYLNIVSDENPKYR